MASIKAEKPVASQASAQAKKEPATASASIKAPASKAAPKRAAQKPQEPKKKMSRHYCWRKASNCKLAFQ
ncbi:hypothetical protein V2J09_003728 [Rumex salicifolius]